MNMDDEAVAEKTTTQEPTIDERLFVMMRNLLAAEVPAAKVRTDGLMFLKDIEGLGIYADPNAEQMERVARLLLQAQEELKQQHKPGKLEYK